jgi:hypothetical protein
MVDPWRLLGGGAGEDPPGLADLHVHRQRLIVVVKEHFGGMEKRGLGHPSRSIKPKIPSGKKFTKLLKLEAVILSAYPGGQMHIICKAKLNGFTYLSYLCFCGLTGG